MPINEIMQIEEGSEEQHYVAPRQKRQMDKKSMQPPLTPMIDVTFELLLYFLLTSTFRKDEGQIPASLPAAGGAASEAPPFRPIRIIIMPQGSLRDQVVYTVDNNPPTDKPEMLYAYLESRAKTGDPAEIPVLIKSDGFARWKFVVEAFNAAVRAQFKKIAFSGDGAG
ncbi:MAG TPA: biopolymer transporter ExbD [Phycisphaerae bacterium]|nr:biopolymer transporter ExbD [Phycisphaerae bacterium]HPS52412.1 biopolymer transporter ExbD [Phycisphaerae bacterium]